MDPRVADRVFRACTSVLARAGVESIMPLAALPYPVETVRKALKAYAQDLVQTGRMTEQFREDLANAYSALANFVSDEEMAIVGALSVPPDPNRTGPSRERAMQLARFSVIARNLRAERAVYEAEFRQYLNGLRAVPETRDPRPETRGSDAET